jgi:hypothetical protein
MRGKWPENKGFSTRGKAESTQSHADRQICNHGVTGSNPVAGTTQITGLPPFFGALIFLKPVFPGAWHEDCFIG